MELTKTRNFKVNLRVSIPDDGYLSATTGGVEQLILKAFYQYIKSFALITEIEATSLTDDR